MDLVEQAEEDDSAQRFDRTALVLPNQQSAQARRITSLESQVETLVDVAGRLQQQLHKNAKALEFQRSQVLSKQEVELSRTARFICSPVCRA